MKWVALGLAGAALLVGCQDLDGPAEPPLPSNPTVARALGTFVAAPSNVTAGTVPGSQIDISWQDNSNNETGFEIHRSTTGVSGTFKPLATTAANVAVYSDQLVELGREYCYRVRAVRGKVSNSSFSNIACATPPLPAPSNATAGAVSENHIDLRWQYDSSDETGFMIYRSTDGGSSFSLLTTAAADVAAYSDQGLASGTKYCYQVVAVLVSGNNAVYSEFSNKACATTPPPPAAASETNASPYNSTTVTVSWTDNSTKEDGFRIYRSTDGGAVWNLAGTVWTNYGSVSYMFDDGRQSEQPVCYRVIAFNGAGDSPPSNTACTTPPAGPTNLTWTAVPAETYEFTWNDNSIVEDGYQVLLLKWFNSSGPTCACTVGACNADIYYEEWPLAELPPNSTSYRTTEAIGCGTQFYLVATKDGGRSDPSIYP